MSDSLELLKPNAEIADSELQIEIGDLKAENEILNAQFANLLESSTSLAKELLQQAEILLAQLEGEKSRCDQLRQELNDQGESCAELRSQFETVQAENQRLQAELGNSPAEREELNQELTELRSQLEIERASREQIEAELAEFVADHEGLATDRGELAQLKKWAKEHAAELHREERSMELEKVRWQRELSDARAELADAKATILNQGNKIRELERGYSFKPNPAERRLRLEIGELRSQLETERASREEITNLAPIVIGVEFPDAAKILSQLRAKRKKSTATLGDVEKILEIIEG